MTKTTAASNALIFVNGKEEETTATSNTLIFYVNGKEVIKLHSLAEVF